MNREQGLLNRRGFMGSIAAIGAANLSSSLAGAEFASRSGIKLGFDNFSIRTLGYKAPQLIEYASSLRVDTLLMSDLDVYESLDAEYLSGIREQAERAGLDIQVGTGSICPSSSAYNRDRWGDAEDHARLLIRIARELGSHVARCYLGTQRDRTGDGGIDRHIENMVTVLKSVKSEAEDANVKLAVENHAGDMQAWELAELIEAAGKSFVGATMDPGNAAWTMEDPVVNLEILGPYAVTTGIRDTAVWETEKGADCMWVNMGEGNVDWDAYISRFKNLCPSVPFVLEVISYKWSREIPFLTPEFWSAFPRARADEFARFVKMARQGRPFQIPEGRPKGEASVPLECAQQKYDLESSLDYCRKKLGLGLKP